jgi:hypothetical protein
MIPESFTCDIHDFKPEKLPKIGHLAEIDGY